jgi:hypothetical protein
MFPYVYQLGFETIFADASLFSSIVIILGTVFVVVEMRDNKKLVEAACLQTNSAADQARLTNYQLQQNYELATVDLVTRIYQSANSNEIQKSWKVVRDSNLANFEEYERLSEEKQLAYQQMASLFESIGLLVEKNFVKAELVDDMFSVSLASEMLKPFTVGMRQKFPNEEYFTWFERLYNRLSRLPQSPISVGPNTLAASEQVQ